MGCEGVALELVGEGYGLIESDGSDVGDGV